MLIGPDGATEPARAVMKEVSELSVKELRQELQALGISCSDCIEKGDFVAKLVTARESAKNTSSPGYIANCELPQLPTPDGMFTYRFSTEW